MNIEISIGPAQLKGERPIYIKGKRYWLLSDNKRLDLIELKARARRDAETLEKLTKKEENP